MDIMRAIYERDMFVFDFNTNGPKKTGRCGKCPYVEYCMGGCPAMAMPGTADTNPLAPDPLKCFFYENGYYEKFVSALPGWYNLSVMVLK